jgi:hypothetical protein
MIVIAIAKWYKVKLLPDLRWTQRGAGGMPETSLFAPVGMSRPFGDDVELSLRLGPAG